MIDDFKLNLHSTLVERFTANEPVSIIFEKNEKYFSTYQGKPENKDHILIAEIQPKNYIDYFKDGDLLENTEFDIDDYPHLSEQQIFEFITDKKANEYWAEYVYAESEQIDIDLENWMIENKEIVNKINRIKESVY